MIKHKNKSGIVFLILVIVSILLLVNTTCAYSYFISEQSINKNNKIDKKEKDILLNKGLNLLVSFFSIKQIQIVSSSSSEEDFDIGREYAELMGYDEPNYGNFEFSSVDDISDLNVYCCKNKINGGVCEDLFAGDEDDLEEMCESENIIASTTCEETNECATGCCVYENGEVCTPRSSKWKCEEQGGVFEESSLCEGISVCSMGCCIYGNNAELTTQAQCEEIANESGVEMDYNPSMGEMECISTLENSESQEGACVLINEYSENDCERTTESECNSLFGRFYKGLLCTNPLLETNCEPTDKTTCVNEGSKDGVYYTDSCENIANIYDSSKRNNEDYWNKIYTRQESCNSDENNANSDSCGNCKLELGSICGDDEDEITDFGDYICKDLNCHDAPELISPLGEVLETKDRKNGETWCLYDSAIGTESSPYGNDISTDTVGSLHWKAECNNGVVNISHCGDRREGICVENEINSPDNSESFSNAQCLPNQAYECIMFNIEASEDCEGDSKCKKEYLQEHCTEEKTCELRNIDIADKFEFNMCVPKYPQGFDLRSQDPESNKMICNLASQTCPVVYVKDIDGDWDCEINCDCRDNEFSEKLNDLGISLGDCGSYINYIGKGTQNSKSSGDTNKNVVNARDYSDFSNAISSKKIQPYIDLETIQEMFIGESFSGEADNEFSGVDNMVGGIKGAGGVYAVLPTIFNYFQVGGLSGWQLSPFGAAVVGAGIGAALGGFISKGIGAEGKGAQAIVIAGAIAGALIGAKMAGALTGTLMGIGATGWGLIIVAVVIAFVELTGWGDTKEKDAVFENNPWQAPEGGEDCHLCNEDELGRTCTEYRCHSLGQACYLINKEEGGGECVAMEDDGEYPLITPLKILNNNYTFVDEESASSGQGSVSINALESDETGRKCINSFEQIELLIQTDEYAQCAYSFEQPSSDFDDMENLLDGGMLLRNHTINLNFPSIEFLEQNIGEDFNDEFRKMYSDMRMYLRCKDAWGNYNLDSYLINFCVYEDDETAVNPNQITFSPSDESYLRYNQTETDLRMWTPEPANGSYSLEDKDYSLMENTMQCENSLNPSSGNGWLCNTTLNDLTKDENKFYIRCNDSVGNINQQSISYELYNSKSELEIDSIEFSSVVNEKLTKVGNKEIMSLGQSPVSVQMEIQTKGGSNNGESSCTWNHREEGTGTEFSSDTGVLRKTHSQMLTSQLQGNHSYIIECEDAGGNKVQKKVYYILKLDTNDPEISRIYYDSGKLKIKTSEIAECYLNNESNCDFNKDDAGVERMSNSGLSKEHSADWEQDKEYYIRCFDKWENYPHKCSAIIKAEDVL